jgi:hypothetical protein
MEIFFVQIIIAGFLYFLLQKYVKSKSKSAPHTNGLHIASILSCLSLLTYQKVNSYAELFFTHAILFVAYFMIGYTIGYIWRKFRPTKES